MPRNQFVKAATTKVSPENSRREIEQMLRRYGALGFSFAADLEHGTVRIEFVVPDSPAKGAPRIPVRIPINVLDVFNALFSFGSKDAATTMRMYPGEWARAERVAWRNLVLWIDAALSAASIGLRTIAETFAGDRLVTDEAGNTMRVTELLQMADGALPRGGRLLLLGAGNGAQP